MDPTAYTLAVQALLRLGRPDSRSHWLNYLDMGLTEADVPDLIRLATDHADFDLNNPASWGPIHAWRALGQLRAPAAVEPLLNEFEWFDETDHEWAFEEVPDVLAMIGPPATDPVGRYIKDTARRDQARVFAANALPKIAERFPDQRPACIEHLRQALEKGDQNEPDTNGFLVSDLLDLKAAEAAPAIEKAYAAGWVDRWICGTWEDVRRELEGLPPLPCTSLWDKMLADRQALSDKPQPLPPPAPKSIPHPRPRRSDRDRQRDQRKRQRQARKRGRRR